MSGSTSGSSSTSTLDYAPIAQMAQQYVDNQQSSSPQSTVTPSLTAQNLIGGGAYMQSPFDQQKTPEGSGGPLSAYLNPAQQATVTSPQFGYGNNQLQQNLLNSSNIASGLISQLL